MVLPLIVILKKKKKKKLKKWVIGERECVCGINIWTFLFCFFVGPCYWKGQWMVRHCFFVLEEMMKWKTVVPSEKINKWEEGKEENTISIFLFWVLLEFFFWSFFLFCWNRLFLQSSKPNPNSRRRWKGPLKNRTHVHRMEEINSMVVMMVMVVIIPFHLLFVPPERKKKKEGEMKSWEREREDKLECGYDCIGFWRTCWIQKWFYPQDRLFFSSFFQKTFSFEKV